MAIKQNAEDFASEFPTAAKVVEEAFYVDDSQYGNAEDFASEFPTAAKVVEEAFYVDDSQYGNAEDFASEFPTAAKVVEEAFYVDDGLTGADSPEEAIYLQQELFARGAQVELQQSHCVEVDTRRTPRPTGTMHFTK